MNGKLLKCKIDVTKVQRERLFEGEKGVYLDVDIWINEEPDKYGNDCSVQQHTKKDEEKIYIGSGKWFKPKSESDNNTDWIGKKSDSKTPLDAARETTEFRNNLNDEAIF